LIAKIGKVLSFACPIDRTLSIGLEYKVLHIHPGIRKNMDVTDHHGYSPSRLRAFVVNEIYCVVVMMY
jgi:hypothetical protein